MVSLIIPHHNRSALIAETLLSLEEQSVEDWEALIVDYDSETDEAVHLKKLIARHPRMRLLTRQGGLTGPSASRNLGLREATGEYVIFLDSDDLLAPQCLENRIAAAAAAPEADLWVFPSRLFHELPGDSETLWNQMCTGEDDLIRFLRSDAPWCVTSPMWRHETIVALGGFNERVMYGDDAELHLRALLTGLRVVQYPQTPPDVFIRRSDVPRITRGNRPELVESRYVRLEEITRLLKEFRVPANRKEAWQTWEGQYFVEAEHLLFHYPKFIASPAIRRVLNAWKQEFRPGFYRQWIVGSYLAVALASKDRAYLLLRIARRIARLILPRAYFS